MHQKISTPTSMDLLSKTYRSFKSCDTSSTHTLAKLLRPRTRQFTKIISTWRLQVSSKFNEQKFKKKSIRTLNYRKFLSRCGFVEVLSTYHND